MHGAACQTGRHYLGNVGARGAQLRYRRVPLACHDGKQHSQAGIEHTGVVELGDTVVMGVDVRERRRQGYESDLRANQSPAAVDAPATVRSNDDVVEVGRELLKLRSAPRALECPDRNAWAQSASYAFDGPAFAAVAWPGVEQQDPSFGTGAQHRQVFGQR